VEIVKALYARIPLLMTESKEKIQTWTIEDFDIEE